MNLVWRIEDKEGKGPYKEWTDWCRDVHKADYTNPSNFPDPTQDGLSRTMEDFCGFSSLSQLRIWFRQAGRKKLEELGFKLSLYIAEEIQIGAYQCLFKKDKAILVTSFPPSSAD